MSQASIAATPEVEVPSIPVAQLAPWAAFFFLLAAVVLFFISSEQGIVSMVGGTAIHEWVHDGRHLLGYPCH